MTITIDRDEAVRSLEAHHSMLTRLSGVADLTPYIIPADSKYTPDHVEAVRADLEAGLAAERKETERAQLQAGEAKVELEKVRARLDSAEESVRRYKATLESAEALIAQQNEELAKARQAAREVDDDNTLETSRTRSRDRMLATALRKDAAQARTHLSKAVTLFEDDDFDKAMRQLQLALDILPERGEAQ